MNNSLVVLEVHDTSSLEYLVGMNMYTDQLAPASQTALLGVQVDAPGGLL